MHSQSPRHVPSTATFLRSAEVAAILQVSPKTVARWAQQGLLPCQRNELLQELGQPPLELVGAVRLEVAGAEGGRALLEGAEPRGPESDAARLSVDGDDHVQKHALGGHRRYPESAIRELAASLVQEVVVA
jgi:hypothetical protein